MGDERSQVAAAEAAVRWRLTPRQARVLELLVRGHTNRAIAELLGCAVNTVEYHVTIILRKAGARARTELVTKVFCEPGATALPATARR